MTAPDGALQWVWLRSESVSLMFARASEPVVAEAQAALIYLYTVDV